MSLNGQHILLSNQEYILRISAHLAVIAVGQENNKAVLAQPLGLTAAHELVENYL